MWFARTFEAVEEKEPVYRMERILAGWYLKWICGYANAYGGTIYIGTDDDGDVVGIDNAKDLSERIPNKITDTMD